MRVVENQHPDMAFGEAGTFTWNGLGYVPKGYAIVNVHPPAGPVVELRKHDEESRRAMEEAAAKIAANRLAAKPASTRASARKSST